MNPLLIQLACGAWGIGIGASLSYAFRDQDLFPKGARPIKYIIVTIIAVAMWWLPVATWLFEEREE